MLYTQFGSGRPKILSQERKNMITSAGIVSGSSSRKIAREILKKAGQRVNDEPVRRERHRHELKPLHILLEGH